MTKHRTIRAYRSLRDQYETPKPTQTLGAGKASLRAVPAVRSGIYGFTLVELIIVITLVSVLAAVALARYVDLKDEAREAAARGFAATVSSGDALNVAACASGNADCV